MLAFALLAPLGAGCTADATGGAPISESTLSTRENAEGAVVTVTGGVTNTVSKTGQAVGVCAPLTCCFPTGAEWGQTPLEDSLRALGCTTPAAYSEKYGSSNWWMFTKCTASPTLLGVIAKYSNVAPYYSTLAINECLYMNNASALRSTEVFVQFDPTCSSCRSR